MLTHGVKWYRRLSRTSFRHRADVQAVAPLEPVPTAKMRGNPLAVA